MVALKEVWAGVYICDSSAHNQLLKALTSEITTAENTEEENKWSEDKAVEEMQLLIIETEDSKKEEGQGLQKDDRGRLGENGAQS